MPTLHLLRHAKSDRSAPVADHERPLNARGRRAAPRIGRLLADTGGPDVVLTSSAVRARDTAELVAEMLSDTVTVRSEPALYLADDETLRARLTALDPAVDAALLVAHNPGIGDLAVRLADPADRRRITSFPTAALATLEVPAWATLTDGCARLASFVVPRDL